MSKIITTINSLIEKHYSTIDDWFETKFLRYTPIFNTSVDIRNSDYKISAVDTNIFPAGYNNFNQSSQKYASHILKEYLNSHYPKCKRLLIISEHHTRNIKYLNNISTLQNMLISEGFTVMIANPDITEQITLTTEDKQELQIFTISKEDDLIKTANDFIPELIIINNDFTKGIPKILLSNNQNQPLIPSPYLGWFNRLKSNHFKIYNELSKEFCEEFNIDSWLLSALTSDCHNVNFAIKNTMNSIAEKVDILIKEIGEKFQQYKINSTPHVFVKANNGTYGMGITVVRNGDEMLEINKKIKNKMHKIKDKQIVTSVLIQEGIPTNDTFQNMSSETLVYNIGYKAVCFLCRYHNAKDEFSNLNAPGCNFIDISKTADKTKLSACNIISKFAALSAAIEQHNIKLYN